MFKLENIETSETQDCSVRPKHISGVWECGDFRITDPGAAQFRVVEVPDVEQRHITRLAFLSRFTDTEAIAFDLASIGATVQAATMRRFMQKVNAATYIDLDLEDTRTGVIGLEEAGLLQLGRALEILDTEILDSECYQGGGT